MDTEHHKSKISVSMHMHTCSNPEHRCHAIWMGLKCNEKSMQKESHCHLLFFGGISQEHLGRKMQTVGIIMLLTSAYSPKASFLGQIHSAKGFTGIKVWQNAQGTNSKVAKNEYFSCMCCTFVQIQSKHMYNQQLCGAINALKRDKMCPL